MIDQLVECEYQWDLDTDVPHHSHYRADSGSKSRHQRKMDAPVWDTHFHTAAR